MRAGYTTKVKHKVAHMHLVVLVLLNVFGTGSVARIVQTGLNSIKSLRIFVLFDENVIKYVLLTVVLHIVLNGSLKLHTCNSDRSIARIIAHLYVPCPFLLRSS